METKHFAARSASANADKKTPLDAVSAPAGPFSDLPLPAHPQAPTLVRLEDRGDPFRTALAALQEGVLFLDRQGRIIACNPACEKILGLSQADLTGRTLQDSDWDAVREDGSPLAGDSHPALVALRTGQTQHDVVIGLRHQSGPPSWILLQAEPVFRPGEAAPQAVVCSFADITEARDARLALELAKQEAEEAGHVKDQFVSLMAHDLRAPIAAAMSMVQMVTTDRDPALAEQQRETLRAVYDRLEQQLSLIDEVLKLTRLRTGKLRVRKRPVTAGVLLSVALGLRFQAEQKGQRLINEVPEGLVLAADPILFGHVMQNLVSNAIKFSPPGATVRMFVPPERPGTVAVRDEGVGIEPKRIPDLFRSDVRTSTLGTAGERGTGMGLPLSYDIMAAHGGALRLETEPGKGSTFYADLPTFRPVVLVVDDEVDLRTLFKHYLVRQGCEVIEAGSGEEALDQLQTVHPTLVITDIQMPRLDGFGLLDAIRRNPDTAEIPVIVVTVGTDVEIRDKAFSLGANDFVTKPIVPNDFLPRARRFLT